MLQQKTFAEQWWKVVDSFFENLYHLSGSLKALRSIISWPGDGRLAIWILRDTYSKFGQKLLEGVNTPSTSARYYQLRPNKSDWSPRISSNKKLSSSSNHECKILLFFDLVCSFLLTLCKMSKSSENLSFLLHCEFQMTNLSFTDWQQEKEYFVLICGHHLEFSLQTEPLSQGYYLKHTTGHKTVSWIVNTWSKAGYINE